MRRKIIFIGFIFLLVALYFFISWRNYEPLETIRDADRYIYKFDKLFLRGDVLAYSNLENVSFIELHFSNHRIIRYISPSFNNDLPTISRWPDPCGRTRVSPVISLGVSSFLDTAICVGKDYEQFAGTITRGLKLKEVISDGEIKDISIANRPLHSLFKITPSLSGAVIEKQAQFRLKKIDMPASIEDGHVQTWEYICPSEDGKNLAVSSFDGCIYFIESKSGKLLWKYSIPDGRGSSVTISDDGRYVLAGEHSADGNLYCLNAADGKLIWQYRTADDVGSLEDSLPGVGRWASSIKPNARDVWIGKNNIVFVRSRRTRLILDENGNRKSIGISKIYAFDLETGQRKWMYPEKGSLEGSSRSSSTVRISSDGKFVSWVIFDWESGLNPYLMVFNGETGEILWTYQCDTLKKFFKISAAYNGATFSQDARYLAMPLKDGRLLIFDNKESLRQKKGVLNNVIFLTVPLEAGRTPVMTHMTKIRWTSKNDIIVMTGNTYTTPLANTKIPPLFHPNANSVFCLDLSGKLKWRFTLGGNPSGIDIQTYAGREYLVMTCAHSIRIKDINEHGIYLFDLNKAGGGFSKVMAFYHTNGIAVDCALSPDLTKAYTIEAVIDMDDSTKIDYRGKHRVIFFEVNE